MTDWAGAPRRALLDLRRAAAVLWTLLRFGGGPLLRAILRLPHRGPSGPVRLRLASEYLGLTYLKFGQFLAMRFDVLPARYCQELGRLFDDVPPTTFEAIAGVIQQELGRPADELFGNFERGSLAAGSVAQVHRARTRDGRAVAVKVQRPGIRPIFEADMRNAGRLAALIDALGLLGFVSARDMVHDFRTWTTRELDFTLEGQTADRLRRDALPYEVVPEVFWTLTTSRVLTMELLEGPNATQIQAILDRGGRDLLETEYPALDLDLVMERLGFISLRQLFVTGFFHGDPHPGNVIFLPDNRVAYVDFGIFGELAASEREVWRRHFEAFSTGNIREAVYQYSKLLIADPDSDIVAFQREAVMALSRVYQANLNPDSPPEQRHVATTSAAMLELLREHRLRVSLNNLLFWRTLVALNASAFRLSPRFDLLGIQRRFFARYRPDPLDEIANTIRATIEDQLTALLAGELGQVRQVLTLQSRGELQMNVTLGGSQPTERVRDRHARAVTLALVGLSFAVAGATTPADAPWRLALLALAVPVLGLSFALESRR